MSEALARRLGVLFVMALQSDDPEIREAAYIERDELDMRNGPIFKPVLSLVEMAEGGATVTEEMVERAAHAFAPEVPKTNPCHYET